MFKMISFLSFFIVSSNLMAMSEEQFDRYANAQRELTERNYNNKLEQKKCVGEKILDESNSSVKSVEVTSLRFRSLVERFITDDYSGDYKIEFKFVLDRTSIPVSCDIWTKGSKSLQTDLIWLCKSQGKNVDLTAYTRHIAIRKNSFVISRGCFNN